MELEESTCLTSGSTTKPQSSRQQGTGTKTDQWNKTESPEINPHTYGQLIFDKGVKNIQWRKENLFNKWFWETWSTTCKRMKLEHFLTPSDINHSRILYDPPPRVMETEAKINKWDLIKLESFCTMKETISKVKRQPSEWEKKNSK